MRSALTPKAAYAISIIVEQRNWEEAPREVQKREASVWAVRVEPTISTRNPLGGESRTEKTKQGDGLSLLSLGDQDGTRKKPQGRFAKSGARWPLSNTW